MDNPLCSNSNGTIFKSDPEVISVALFKSNGTQQRWPWEVDQDDHGSIIQLFVFNPVVYNPVVCMPE